MTISQAHEAAFDVCWFILAVPGKMAFYVLCEHGHYLKQEAI